MRSRLILFVILLAHRAIAGPGYWTPSLQFAPGSTVDANLVVDPNDQLTIFTAATRADGGVIYRTANAGLTWQEFALLPHESRVLTITISSSTRELLAVTFTKIYVFDASGQPVKLLPVPPSSGFPSDLVVDSNNPMTWYISFHTFFLPSDGVMKTTDAGAHWASVLHPSTVDEGSISHLAISPHDSRVLFAAAEYSGILWKTSNAGASWQNVTPLRYVTEEIDFDQSQPTTVYALVSQTVWMSSDSGETWSNFSELPSIPHSMAFDPTNHNTIIAVGVNAAYRSTDGGRTYTRMVGADGTPFLQVLDRVRFDKMGHAYAASTGGVFQYAAALPRRRAAIHN